MWSMKQVLQHPYFLVGGVIWHNFIEDNLLSKDNSSQFYFKLLPLFQRRISFLKIHNKSTQYFYSTFSSFYYFYWSFHHLNTKQKLPYRIHLMLSTGPSSKNIEWKSNISSTVIIRDRWMHNGMEGNFKVCIRWCPLFFTLSIQSKDKHSKQF